MRQKVKGEWELTITGMSYNIMDNAMIIDFPTEAGNKIALDNR